MHYCLMLFTKEFPTKEKIDSMMEKYTWDNNHSDDHDEYPQFTYDWYEIGGRYNGSIKLKVDLEDEKYRWKFYAREPRNGRLFWCHLLNDMQEHKKPFYSEGDCFSSMGANDGFLYVDGAWIADTINLMNKIVTLLWPMTEKHIPNNDFEERLKSAKNKAKEENQFVTITDYHD